MYRPTTGKFRGSADDLPREFHNRVADAAGLVASGLSREEAAELSGCDLTGRELPMHHPYVPTPAMIEAECEKIRAGLSEKELRRRCMLPQSVRWRLPDVSISDLVA